jgi:hypothetical protein
VGRVSPRASRVAPFIAFPALWFLCVGLAQIHLLAIQQPWSKPMWVVAFVVPAAFILGGLATKEVTYRPSAGLTARDCEIDPSIRRRLRALLLACAILGNLEEVHQFIAGRTVPLFSSHIDAARFALPGGPTIVLTDLLTVAAVVALVLPRRLLSRDALPEIGIASFALLGFALAAGRGTIIQAVTVAAISRWLYRGRPPMRVLVTGIAVVLVFSAGFFYLRTSQHENDTLGIELREKVYPEHPVVRPVVPVYLALATNMEALSRLVDYFPEHKPYGRGAYVAHGLDLFIPGAKDVQAVSAVVSPPWVTSTVAGPFWADGGLPLVVVGLGLIGAVVCGTWRLAVQARELRFVLVGANFLFLALFGVYVNLFTQQVDWLLITPLLWAFGAAAESRRAIPEALPMRLRVRSVGARGAEP